MVNQMHGITHPTASLVSGVTVVTVLRRVCLNNDRVEGNRLLPHAYTIANMPL